MKKTMSLALISALVTIASPAFAGKPVLRAIPKTITLKLGQLDNDQTKTVDADIQINQIYTEYVKKPAQCTELDCNDTIGDGTKGDWKNYFNVPKSQKPRALAAAIKGIGETTAERIIDLGYFTSKPRSWYAFSNEIRSAQNGLNRAGYNYNFSENVLGAYGYENAVNLGYYSENACTVRKYECSTYVEVEREEFYKYVPVTAKVVARNMVLQSFEKETFNITLNHIAGEADVDVRSGYNKYTTEVSTANRNETYIELNGIGRIKGKLPVETVRASLARDAKGLVLTVNVSPQSFVSNEDNAGAQNVLRYDVCNTSWVGTCYKVAREAHATPLKNSTVQTIRLDDGQYKAGSKYFVRYSVGRKGSKFYSENYYNDASTSSVKY